MKIKRRYLYVQVAAVAAGLLLAGRVNAEPPRDELVHAYRLIQTAKADYAGHRVAALDKVHEAGRKLGLHLEGDAPQRERQWKSDEKLREARRLLSDARDKMEGRDRNRISHELDESIHELDVALKGH